MILIGITVVETKKEVKIMCLKNTVIGQSTCDDNLSLEEKLKIARQRSGESGPSVPPEYDDWVKEITK